MLKNNIIAQILEMTPQGAGKWRKENRPIIHLLEKYFEQDDLELFLNEGFIPRFEILEEFEIYGDRIEKKIEESVKLLGLDFDVFVNYINWQDMKFISQLYFDIETTSVVTNQLEIDYKNEFDKYKLIKGVTLKEYFNFLDAEYKEFFYAVVFALGQLDEKQQNFLIKTRLLDSKTIFAGDGYELEQEYKERFLSSINTKERT